MTDNFSLMKLVAEHKIDPTNYKPKIPTTIEGLNSNEMIIYRIPLKYLFFNEHNGRFASSISRFSNENKGIIPERDELSQVYNDKIATLITESNSASLKNTQKSIKEFGQQEFGYVLDDGRVIDGNRRFTALRNIQKETGTPQYFEAVILPFSYDKEVDRTKIKKLELVIQHGKESRQKYDDVDEAVDIYRTIKETTVTVNEYAHDANKRKTTIEAKLYSVELMKKFLEFINADTNSFYIIRDLKIYSLFEEGAKKLNKEFPYDGAEKAEAVDSFIGFVIYQIKLGKSTKAYAGRDFFKNIISKEKVRDEYMENTEDAIDDLQESFEQTPIKTVSDLNIALNNSTNKNSIRKISEEYNDQINRNDKDIDDMLEKLEVQKKYLDNLVANNGLSGALSFEDLNQDNLQQLKNTIKEITELCSILGKIYDAE